MATRRNRLLQVIVRARDEASGVLGRVGKGLKGLGAIAGITGGVAVGVTLVRAFRSAVQVGSEFGATISSVGALTRATGQDMKALADQAKALGRATVFSANEAAQAQVAFAKAGFDVGRIMASLPATLNLAAAGELQMGEAAEITSNLMRALSLEASDLDGVVDLLAATANRSNTTVLELGEAFKFAAPAAASAGAELSDVSAVLAILANRGINASIAGTGVRKSLTTMFAAVKDGKGELGKIAGQLFDAEGKFVGFAKAVDIMSAAGITARDAYALFGERAGAVFDTLLNVGSEAIADTRAELEGLTGFAEEVARKKLDNLAGDLRLLAAAWEGLQIAITEKSNPALRAFVQQLTAVIQRTGEATENSAQFGTTVANVVEVLSSGLKGALRLVQAFAIAWEAPQIAIQETARYASLFAMQFATQVANVASAMATIANGIPQLGGLGGKLNEAAADARRLAFDLATSATGFGELSDEAADRAAGVVLGVGKIIDEVDGISAATRKAAAAIEETGKKTEDATGKAADSAAAATGEIRDLSDAYEGLEKALEAAGFITAKTAAATSADLLDMKAAADEAEIPLAVFFNSIREDLSDLIERAKQSRIELSDEIVGLANDLAASDALLAPTPEDAPLVPLDALQAAADETIVPADLIDEEYAQRSLEALQATDALSRGLNFAEAAAQSFASAFVQNVEAVVGGSKSIGEAVKGLISGVLKALAQEALGRAAFELAEAFAALARYDYGAAAAHFSAAAQYGTASAVLIAASAAVTKFREGGRVPGTGSGDRVPALLEPAEEVLRRSDAEAIRRGRAIAIGGAGAVRVVPRPGIPLGFSDVGPFGSSVEAGVLEDLAGSPGRGAGPVRVSIAINAIDGDSVRRVLLENYEALADTIQLATERALLVREA